MRDQELGVLVLLFADASTPPSPALRSSAQGFAALLALSLEQERLSQATARAEQARQEFLAALNHELRTPATALVLDSFVVRSGVYGDLPVALRKGIEQIESHVEWLVGVLESVLDLGGPEAEVASEEGEIVQPREVVLELLRRVEPAAAKKELPILFYSPRALPVLQTDVASFSRILLHLFSNAIKYTSEGRIEVRLELSSRPVHRRRHERVLIVRVTDTGRGIPPEELERIFEPFAQVGDGARSDSHVRGPGLGLAVARTLARSLRGEIRIDSTVGTGTTVTFMVPYTR
jgi:protein-histidine pros-kinase